MSRSIRTALLLTLALTAIAATAGAEQQRCPLPVDECLSRFDAMSARPWFGIYSDRDSSSGRLTVTEVRPGGPAARAGIRVGDVLQTIDGKPAGDWFAGRAGWKDAPDMPVAVVRGRETVQVRLPVQRIPEEVLARAVGEHMLEAHLAYMTTGEHSHDEHH